MRWDEATKSVVKTLLEIEAKRIAQVIREAGTT